MNVLSKNARTYVQIITNLWMVSVWIYTFKAHTEIYLKFYLMCIAKSAQKPFHADVKISFAHCTSHAFMRENKNNISACVCLPTRNAHLSLCAWFLIHFVGNEWIKAKNLGGNFLMVYKSILCVDDVCGRVSFCAL